jgi:hypothetical protein
VAACCPGARVQVIGYDEGMLGVQRFGAVTAMVVAALLGGCGETTDERGGPVGGAAGAPPSGGKAGSKDPGGAGTQASGSRDAGGDGGASGEPVDACASHTDDAPGEPLYSEMERGAGECRGIALAQVLSEIREARPDLADVSELYRPDPDRGGDGSFVYAFRRPDGGFAVVLKRGGGDCPSGCTVNDYWYFETGESCTVLEVGEAHRDFEHCMEPDQLPRWGIPRAALPSEICDADLSAQDLNGSYAVVTCGHVNACWDGKEPQHSAPLPATLRLSIAQDAADLSHGTVVVDGTGEPVLDGRVFDATFERRKLKVAYEYSNLPANCVEQWSLEFEYDFEGLGRRQLLFNQTHTPDCDEQPSDYCKGQIAADFGTATLEQDVGQGGVSGAGGTAGAGSAGEGQGGTADENGGASDEVGTCDGASAVVPSELPSCAPSDVGTACGECLKARCCEDLQNCYGSKPRGACGYGESADEMGQFDCIRSCYVERADGVKSESEVLEECAEQCRDRCELSEATHALMGCARGVDGGDDCLDACFPVPE